MNGTNTETGWTLRKDGSWEAMIRGTSYVVDREDGIYYLYRSLGYEQIGASKSLAEIMKEVER